MPERIEIEYSQTIGNVGYVLPMLEKLRVAEIIDKYCPKRCDGDYNHGEIINLMVCQTTQGRKPLYKLQDWFRDTLKVDDLLGYDSDKLTDDRFGDALSAVSRKIESIYTEVVLNTVSQYGVDLSHIHNDLTSFQFYGVYETYDEFIAQLKAQQTASEDTSQKEDSFSEFVTYGYNRTGNQTLKVIIGNLSITSDGQIPVSIQVHKGKTADTTTYAETYQKLQSQLTKAPFLLIADSKLATPENLVTIAISGGVSLHREP